MIRKVDINADLGEGAGNDHLIMPYISSCSIACGGHYGDEVSMTAAIRLAKTSNVKVGAHPSYPDRDHFGRKPLVISKEDLERSIFEQILGFMAVCETEDIPMNHVKLHGALYNYAAKDAAASDAVISALERLKVRTILYCPYNSVLHRKAENLFLCRFEAFVDRLYTDDGSLLARSEKGSLITDPVAAWRQLWDLVDKGQAISHSGSPVTIEASTFCLHGDNPNAISILKYITEQMALAKIELDK